MLSTISKSARSGMRFQAHEESDVADRRLQ